MNTERKSLIWAQVLLALAALWLHLKIHPYMIVDPLTGTSELHMGKLIAFIFCLIDVILVTGLFIFPKTAVYGYLLNGMLVIFGSVMMAHYSLAVKSNMNWPFDVWFWKTTMPDIFLAVGDFMVGKSIYGLALKELAETKQAQCV